MLVLHRLGTKPHSLCRFVSMIPRSPALSSRSSSGLAPHCAVPSPSWPRVAAMHTSHSECTCSPASTSTASLPFTACARHFARRAHGPTSQRIQATSSNSNSSKSDKNAPSAAAIPTEQDDDLDEDDFYSDEDTLPAVTSSSGSGALGRCVSCCYLSTHCKPVRASSK